MKLLLVGIAGLFSLSACGSEVIVGDGVGGNSGASNPTAGGNAGAFTLPGGSGNVAGGESLPEGVAEACSANPAAYETYSTADELEALLVGQWRRCLAPQISGEDVGVEFTEDGKIYPLTTDDTLQVVRRTGVDYEKTWVYIPPGEEDPISHQPSTRGIIKLDEVYTDAPKFTLDPRQMRILFSPALSRYIPLLP